MDIIGGERKEERRKVVGGERVREGIERSVGKTKYTEWNGQ